MHTGQSSQVSGVLMTCLLRRFDSGPRCLEARCRGSPVRLARRAHDPLVRVGKTRIDLVHGTVAEGQSLRECYQA